MSRATDSKPFASLTSGLLARKGQAKPAMRPQAYGVVTPHEDLGWNDMGQSGIAAAPTPVVPAHLDIHPAAGELPVPVRQQAEIAEELGVVSEAHVEAPEIHIEPVVEPVVAAPAPEPTPAPVVVPTQVVPVSRAKAGAGSKAAFTLRLDPARHLKLRLACAVSHRSAQSLVTEALDELLKTMPELDEVARGMGRN